MPADGRPGATGEMLMKVSRALATLGGHSTVASDHAASTKLGG